MAKFGKTSDILRCYRVLFYFLLFLVKLVERNPCPNGFQLVDPDKSGKKNQFDLVELAAQIQTVSNRNVIYKNTKRFSEFY